MHGLKVMEAIEVLKFVLERWGSNPKKPLVVVTGTGKHSPGGKAKIKPAVITYLTQQEYRFDVEEGQVVIRG